METKLKFHIDSFPVPASAFGRILGEARPFSAVFGGLPVDHAPVPSSVIVPFSAISAETLERLCDEFRDEVFRIAGERRPPQAEDRTQDSRVNELETALAFMVDHAAGPICRETREGFANARRVLGRSEL